MSARRQQEAHQAAQILEVDLWQWFGLPEGTWLADHLTARLQDLLADFKPTPIYAPSRVDFHPEHQRVAHLLAGVFAPYPALSVRVYQIHLPLSATLTNLVVDTSPVADLSRAALLAHTSQSYSVLKSLRLRRYAAHFYGLPQQAEEFWEMPAAHYARLHQRLEQPETAQGSLWPTAMFWGLRFHPFSDPLAYLRGQAERRRVAGLVGLRRTFSD
jgi:LmbE family N-acetylglucosaminyl deacetylase